MNGVRLMSELNNVTEDVKADESDGSAVTAGMMLRHAREAAGLHVAALAVAMKIPVKKLEALEADRLDLLLDAVFVRAFAASVCRALKIDAAPILAKLPQSSVPRLNVGGNGINAPFRVPVGPSGMSAATFVSKPWMWAVVGLLVAALFLIFWPQIQAPEPTQATDQIPAVVFPVPNQLAPTTTPSESLGEAIPTPSAPMPLPGEIGSPPQAQIVQENSSANAQVLFFKASGPSWVEVTDAKGVVQVRKTLSSGESLGVSGALPLSVVVGRVDVIEVEIRGKAFGILPIAKDNVARFEVK